MAVGLPENQGFVLVTKEDAVSQSAPAGTYKAPAAGDAVQVLNEGLAFNPTQEIVDRDIRTSTIEAARRPHHHARHHANDTDGASS